MYFVLPLEPLGATLARFTRAKRSRTTTTCTGAQPWLIEATRLCDQPHHPLPPPPLPPLIKNRDQTRTSGFRFRPTARTAIKPPLVSPTPLNIRDNAPRGAATAEFPGSRQKKKRRAPTKKHSTPQVKITVSYRACSSSCPSSTWTSSWAAAPGRPTRWSWKTNWNPLPYFLSKGFLLWGKLRRFREIAFYAFFFPFFLFEIIYFMVQ